MNAPADSMNRGIVTTVARMRAMGTGLGLLPLGVVLHENGAAPWVWALALLHGLGWPWIARALALRSASPLAVEHRNLMADSLLGGVWVAVMAFNAAPSIAFASMMLMDKFAFGGPKFAARCLPVFLGASAVTAVLTGFAFDPASSPAATFATLPLLLAYPSLIAYAAWTLSARVRAQRRELEALSRTCELTGLSNRRALLAAAEHEFRRFHRSGNRSAFLLLDVDRFKQLNDEFGHAAGDDVLRALAATLQGLVRDTDTCGRLGGDEFGMVLADTTEAGVTELAGRVLTAISTHPLHEGLPRITVSIGYAVVGAGMPDTAVWIAQADAALYRAKAAGRNRAAGPPTPFRASTDEAEPA